MYSQESLLYYIIFVTLCIPMVGLVSVLAIKNIAYIITHFSIADTSVPESTTVDRSTKTSKQDSSSIGIAHFQARVNDRFPLSLDHRFIASIAVFRNEGSCPCSHSIVVRT